MYKDTMKPVEGDAHAMHELARDEWGRLYSVGMRQLFDPTKEIEVGR